jgi:hypothetical protein
MNKEQQELLDESYKNYKKEIIRQRQIQKEEVARLRSQGKRVRVSLIELLTQEEFIDECKTYTKFSERWGLKIEERELSLEERTKILVSKSDNKKDFYDRNGRLIIEDELVLNESNIPTKQITITYNDKKIESYE